MVNNVYYSKKLKNKKYCRYDSCSLFEHILKKCGEVDILFKLIDKYKDKIDKNILLKIVRNNNLDSMSKVSVIKKILDIDNIKLYVSIYRG